MSFYISCTNCGQNLEAEEEHIGHEMPCPSCSEVIRIDQKSSSNKNSYFQTACNPQIESAGARGRDQIGKIYNNIKTSKVIEELNPKAKDFVNKSKEHAGKVFQDLKSIQFKDEIIPIDSRNFGVITKDFVFWSVSLLGILPLFIATISSKHTQITIFSWFFAFVWGVIFKVFILKNKDPWKQPVMSLFFTGVIGVAILLISYQYILPHWYLNLSESDNQIISLCGYIFQTGLNEELLKAFPILIIIYLSKGRVNPLSIVAMGVFSGLGFAAFENIGYEHKAVNSTIRITANFGDEGTAYAVQSAMITTMLRSISLVFCHATWSGIVGYFIAAALIRREKIIALSLVGLGVASTLHGAYDWLQGMQQTLAALIAGFSFVLFYGYLSKLESMVSLQEVERKRENVQI